MKGDLKEWQTFTCPVGRTWKGAINQISLQFSPEFIDRGDVWIANLQIELEPITLQAPQPDIASSRVVPQIVIPGVPQGSMERAFKVLDNNMVTDVPIFGFTYPVIDPGGAYYGGGWWLIDSAIAMNGTKWTNQSFVENAMRGFADVQTSNPDGRIDGSGIDWPNRGSVGNKSQLPLFFDVAYDIERRTDDAGLRRDIYTMMRRYLDWWLSPVKRDRSTGLVWALTEETFGEVDMSSQYYFELQPHTIAPGGTPTSR
jgi:hypothetical protein